MAASWAFEAAALRILNSSPTSALRLDGNPGEFIAGMVMAFLTLKSPSSSLTSALRLDGNPGGFTAGRGMEFLSSRRALSLTVIGGNIFQGGGKSTIEDKKDGGLHARDCNLSFSQ
jgi:hypothetical protein